MSKLYLKHGHLIIDGAKEYLDGSIIIDNEVIKEVYPFTDKVKEIYEGYKKVNLKGYYVFPLFIELNEYHSMYEVKSNLRRINKDKKLFLTGGIKRKEIDVDYDLIYDLYQDMVFDVRKEGLIEEAFYTDKYVSIDINNVSDEQLKLAIKNIDEDKLIIMGFNAKTCNRLHELKVSNTSIYKYLTGNVLRLFNDDKLKGSLIKGRKADLVVLNKNYEVIVIIKDGEMING